MAGPLYDGYLSLHKFNITEKVPRAGETLPDGLFHAIKLCEPSHKASPEDECGLVVIPKESVFFGKGKESK